MSSTSAVSATTLTALPTASSNTLDALLTDFLSPWSLVSTLLLLATFTILIFPPLLSRSPDTHPFLLSRQSIPAPIRHPQQSSVYRSLDIPHGYPLRSSLGVRDKGSPKWSQGRAGDLRDIWRVAALGAVGDDGEHDTSKVGKVLSVRGREGVKEVRMEDVTRGINAVGKWIAAKGKGMGEGGEDVKVAVCLSNGVELLSCVFASAFHSFSLTLLAPPTSPSNNLPAILSEIAPGILVLEAGTHDLSHLLASTPSIRHILLVAKGWGKDVDWDHDKDDEGLPRGVGVGTWHRIVAESLEGDGEVGGFNKEENERKKSGLGIVSQGTTHGKDGQGRWEVVEFSCENIISATAALAASLSRTHKLTPNDILLPTSSLADSYTLCWTLAALYANASIALNSVAGDDIDLRLASASVSPTVIVAAPGTVGKYVADTLRSGGGPGVVGRYLGGRSLQGGNMPRSRPAGVLKSLEKLRLMVVGHTAGLEKRLASSVLHDLRLVSGARVVYGLTAPRVAGAICQTNVHDYRDRGNVVSVGAPVGSVEVHVVGEEEAVGTSAPKGKLVVKGPSVSSGKAEIEVVMQVESDNTFRLC